MKSHFLYTTLTFCPECGYRVTSKDDKYLFGVGVCSRCVVWDKTPDKRYQSAWNDTGEKLWEQRLAKRRSIV